MEANERNNAMHYTAFIQSKRQGEISGDAFKALMSSNEFIAVLADGLGSGAGANASATVVINEVEKNPLHKLENLFKSMNEKMIGMRGAVAAIMRIHFKERVIEFSSIGNISCYIFKQKSKQIIYPRQKMGYLSGEAHQFYTQGLEYESGDYFLLHSDGISIDNVKALLSEEEFLKVQYAKSDYLKFHNDDASFIAGRLF